MNKKAIFADNIFGGGMKIVLLSCVFQNSYGYKF